MNNLYFCSTIDRCVRYFSVLFVLFIFLILNENKIGLYMSIEVFLIYKRFDKNRMKIFFIILTIYYQ